MLLTQPWAGCQSSLPALTYQNQPGLALYILVWADYFKASGLAHSPVPMLPPVPSSGGPSGSQYLCLDCSFWFPFRPSHLGLLVILWGSLDSTVLSVSHSSSAWGSLEQCLVFCVCPVWSLSFLHTFSNPSLRSASAYPPWQGPDFSSLEHDLPSVTLQSPWNSTLSIRHLHQSPSSPCFQATQLCVTLTRRFSSFQNKQTSQILHEFSGTGLAFLCQQECSFLNERQGHPWFY